MNRVIRESPALNLRKSTPGLVPYCFKLSALLEWEIGFTSIRDLNRLEFLIDWSVILDY